MPRRSVHCVPIASLRPISTSYATTSTKNSGIGFKTIRDQLNKDTPDASALRSSAKVAKDASVNQYKWFPAGSGTEAHPKTRAKGEIWSKPAEFEAAQKSLASEAAKFETLAQGSDMTALRAQFRVLGRACKGCHDSFRIPD